MTVSSSVSQVGHRKGHRRGRVTRLSLLTSIGVLAAVLMLARAQLAAQILINEVLASNSSTNTDDEGDASDWLELYNAGTKPIDLHGFSLTDDAERPERWKFLPRRNASRHSASSIA